VSLVTIFIFIIVDIMGFVNMKSTVFATVLAALALRNADSFSPAFSPIRSTSAVPHRLAGDDKGLDGAQITSARKELKFDDKTGRFFETNLKEEECIPDEEFCTIDEDSGGRIRLTVAEKERIFLDSLQVRSHKYMNTTHTIVNSLSSFFVVVLRDR
jgi:hypothetical protein